MRRPDERGETLVEVVMALAILSLVLVSSYALATGTFRLGRSAGQRTQAVNYLQEQAEALRSYRNAVDWDVTFQTGPEGVGGYSAASGKSFCMIQKTVSGQTRWRPVISTDEGCTKDGVTVSIQSEKVSGHEQYNFRLDAEWRQSSDIGHAHLTTTLVKQDE